MKIYYNWYDKIETLLNMKMYSVTVENAKPADGLVSELDESS